MKRNILQMTQGDPKGCSKESIRTQEGHTYASRTKQHEGEENAGIRTAGGGERQLRERQGKNHEGREQEGKRGNRSPGGDSNMSARLC